MRKMNRINYPSMTFVDFCNYFRGVRIVKETSRNGVQHRLTEVPKYFLYWSGISPAQIREKYTLITR